MLFVSFFEIIDDNKCSPHDFSIERKKNESFPFWNNLGQPSLEVQNKGINGLTKKDWCSLKFEERKKTNCQKLLEFTAV